MRFCVLFESELPECISWQRGNTASLCCSPCFVKNA